MKCQKYTLVKRTRVSGAERRWRSSWFGLVLLSGSLGCTAAVDDERSAGSTSLPLQNGIVLPNGSPIAGAVQVWTWGKGPQDTAARWHQCSGQVISQNTVLTAAHCFREAGMQGETGTRAVAVNRYVGNNNWQYLHTGGYFTADIFVHPDFLSGGQFDWAHDAAVLRAPNNWLHVDSGDAAAIVKNSWGTFEAWAVGYGNYGPNFNDSDSKLRARELDVEYVVEFEGYRYDEYWSDTTTPQLCAGDSGGPLKTWFFSSTLTHGIANSSFNGGAGDCGTTGRWAPTSMNWQFIADVVGTCDDGWSWIYCW